MKFSLPLLLAVSLLLSALRLGAGTPSATRIYLDPDTPATIEVTPVAERWNGVGFMPLRLRIENRAERTRSWSFKFNVNLGYTGDTAAMELSLPVDGGTVAETVVFVPGGMEVAGGQVASLNITVNGPGADFSSQAYLLGGGGGHGGNAVVNAAVSPAQETALFAATNGASGAKTEIAAVDAARWPADWRVWSPFEYVVLSEADYAALDGARRAALHDWVALGGTLDVFRGAGGSGSVGSRQTERRALGWIRHRSERLDDMRDYSFQAPSSPDSFPQSLFTGASTLRPDLKLSTGALGLSIFLIVFGVLVGPINLFVFAPSGRRHRLFVTVPLLSLAASLLMAGYIVVKDGFGGEGFRDGRVLLLPDTNQAVVTQTQKSRTGILLGASFEVPEDAVLTRTGVSNTGWRGNREEQTSSYTRSFGQAGGDWFTSRRIQEHQLKRIVLTRARVELVPGGDDTPIVQSSVATELRNFVYFDDEGRLWRADTVSPGQKVALERGQWGGSVESPAPRGRFFAVGGAAEGVAPIDTLDSIRWADPEFIYTGPLVGARKP